MLKIIDDLMLFFEDCYRRISVREYARLIKISPPTASKMLSDYSKEGLLRMEKYRNYILYYANKENAEFIDLSRIYWRSKLRELLDFIDKELVSPTVVLFGSLAKAEVKSDSDIDLAVFSVKRELDVSEFEKRIKRKIQLFVFKSLKDIKSRELANNIVNGYILKRRLLL